MGDTSRGILDERACFSLHCHALPSLFSSLFLSCPPLLHSPEVLPLTDPSCVQGGEKQQQWFKKREWERIKGCNARLFPYGCQFSAFILQSVSYCTYFTAFCQSLSLTANSFYTVRYLPPMCCLLERDLVPQCPNKSQKLQIRQCLF